MTSGSQKAAVTPRGLHDPEGREGLGRAYAGFQGLLHALLAAHLFQGQAKGLFGGLSRDDADAVAIAEHDVSGIDAHAVDLHRHAEVDHFAAWPLVLGIAAMGKGREAAAPDAVRI